MSGPFGLGEHDIEPVATFARLLEPGPLDGQRRVQQAPAIAHLADHVVGRHKGAIHLDPSERLVGQARHRRDAYPRRAQWHHEHGEAVRPVGLAAVQPSGAQPVLAQLGPQAVQLRAGQPVAAVHRQRPGRDAAEVGAHLGLAVHRADITLAGLDRWQETFALGRGGGQEEEQPDEVHRDHPHGVDNSTAAQFLGEQGRLDQTQTRAPVGRRPVRRQPAALAQPPVDRARVGWVAVLKAGGDLQLRGHVRLIEECAQLRLKPALRHAEGEVHGYSSRFSVLGGPTIRFDPGARLNHHQARLAWPLNACLAGVDLGGPLR